jgi:hypothetical protein
VCRSEEDIAEAFSNIMTLTGDRITKAYHLSPETIPYADMLEYLEHSKNPEFLEASRTVRRLYTASSMQTSDNIIIDMCSLATASDVKRGRVKLQLPGYVNHKSFHYNEKLYCMHLRNILHLLETNPKYYFYPLDPADFGEYKEDYYPISIVDNQAMLLVSDECVLNFTQPEIIHTLYEHLYNQSRIQAKHSKGRDTTIETIRNLIAELEE